MILWSKKVTQKFKYQNFVIFKDCFFYKANLASKIFNFLHFSSSSCTIKIFSLSNIKICIILLHSYFLPHNFLFFFFLENFLIYIKKNHFNNFPFSFIYLHIYKFIDHSIRIIGNLILLLVTCQSIVTL